MLQAEPLQHVVRKPLDPRDYPFRLTGSNYGFPETFDLGRFTRRIEDQLWSSSCLGMALSSIGESILASRGTDVQLSAFHAYKAMRRHRPQLANVDTGAYVADAASTAHLYGLCLDSLWPQDMAKVNDDPPEACWIDAWSRHVERYEHIQDQTNIDAIKYAIIRGFPPLFGMGLRQSFLSIRGPLATHRALFEQMVNEPIIYGHGMFLNGWNDIEKYVIGVSSWSEEFGDIGRVAIPYSHLIDCYDMTVFKDFAGISMEDGFFTPTRLDPPIIVIPPSSRSTTKAKVFLGSDDAFTVVDSGATLFGGLGSSTVRIASGVTDIKTDANFSRIELAGNRADYNFGVIPGTGLLIKTATGLTVDTIASLNRDVTLAFADGSANLSQTGSATFTLGGQVIGP